MKRFFIKFLNIPPHSPSHQVVSTNQPFDFKGQWSRVWQESPNSWQGVLANRGS